MSRARPSALLRGYKARTYCWDRVGTTQATPVSKNRSPETQGTGAPKRLLSRRHAELTKRLDHVQLEARVHEAFEYDGGIPFEGSLSLHSIGSDTNKKCQPARTNLPRFVNVRVKNPLSLCRAHDLLHGVAYASYVFG